MKRAVLALAGVMAVTAPELAVAQEEPRRVLLVGAHPDDEDTNLIAWLQRSGRAEAAYLSLTRGDGGQNLRQRVAPLVLPDALETRPAHDTVIGAGRRGF